jgi:hypothetical protein
MFANCRDGSVRGDQLSVPFGIARQRRLGVRKVIGDSLIGQAKPVSTAVATLHLGLVEAIDGLGQGIVVASPTLPTDGSMPASARRSV